MVIRATTVRFHRPGEKPPPPLDPDEDAGTEDDGSKWRLVGSAAVSVPNHTSAQSVANRISQRIQTEPTPGGTPGDIMIPQDDDGCPVGAERKIPRRRR